MEGKEQIHVMQKIKAGEVTGIKKKEIVTGLIFEHYKSRNRGMLFFCLVVLFFF